MRYSIPISLRATKGDIFLFVLFLARRDQAPPNRHHWIRDDGGRLALTRGGLRDRSDSPLTVLCAAQTGLEVSRHIKAFLWFAHVGFQTFSVVCVGED